MTGYCLKNLKFHSKRQADEVVQRISAIAYVAQDVVVAGADFVKYRYGFCYKTLVGGNIERESLSYVYVRT